MRILEFREKHKSRYFACSSDEDLGRACLKIIRNRLDDDYWYDGDDELEARDVLKLNDGKLAFRFLNERSSYEYEGMMIHKSEDFS